MPSGKIKTQQDPATGLFAAALYLSDDKITPTIATLPMFSTAEEAIDHLKATFPDAVPDDD